MSLYTSISPDKLSRLIGTANAPALIDVRLDEDFAADPRIIPGAVRRSHQNVQDWAPSFSGRNVVVISRAGKKLSEGTAAWLRHGNIAAAATPPGKPTTCRPTKSGRDRSRLQGETMKHAVALIAFGIAMPFIVPAYASTDAAIKPAVIPVAAPDIGAGNDSRRSLETMRGVVAAVDERYDRITVQLSRDATADLKVRDGLLFNAVRYGDPVEVTVENVNGAKTIVGLIKE
jgi:rhodanese-related sulfurtransferase